MISIEAIFAIGGLAMIAVGLLGGIEHEKLKIRQLPNWIRATAIISGIVLLAFSVYLVPSSPFTQYSKIKETEIALQSAQIVASQTAEAKQPPTVQTVVVTQPPLIVTRVVEVTPTSDDQILAVESIPATVSAYLDNDTDPAQSSALEIINGNGSGVTYQHRYSFPDNAVGYAGINFQFDTLQDFSTYNVIEMTIAIDGTPEGCDLYFHDATGNRYPVSCQARFFADKQTITIPLQNYAEVNMKAIRNIYILIHPSASKGEVKVALWNLRFIRQ